MKWCPFWIHIEPCAVPRSPIFSSSWRMSGGYAWPRRLRGSPPLRSAEEGHDGCASGYTAPVFNFGWASMVNWHDEKADNPPWIKPLAEVLRLAPREGYCFHYCPGNHRVDQYADSFCPALWHRRKCWTSLAIHRPSRLIF